MTPGIGEWASAVLSEEGKNIDWIVPNEGGVMWVEAFAIPKSCNQIKEAEKFIKAALSADNLARLAWRKAYHSQSPSRDAYRYMNSSQLQLLKATDIDAIQKLIDQLVTRRLPGPKTTEKDWMKIWAQFKAENPN